MLLTVTNITLTRSSPVSIALTEPIPTEVLLKQLFLKLLRCRYPSNFSMVGRILLRSM